MKVSISWLKELVDLNISVKELIKLLPLRTIGIKEVTEDFIELDMKGYNRADLLSMRGIAYEVAAITGSKTLFEEPEQANFAWNQTKLPKVQVEILNPELCPIYCVAKIEVLEVASSPREWVEKLNNCGIRSINNIADITNLMMLEYGQTMHAFDAAKVTDETMIIRLAKKGEQFVTLDGKNRNLTEKDLLITDPKGILSLSGVMGGKDSEITGDTNTILLEVAIFDPISIRGSSQKFGLHSEASKRIQHGLTKKRLLQAFDNAIKMYEQLGGKLTAISLVGNFEEKSKTIKLTQQKVNSLIGINISPEQVENYLTKLHFIPKVSDHSHLGGGTEWLVEVPYWRLDIELAEDLIEEVARMYGYEKIPSQELLGKLPAKIDQSLFELISKVKSNLVTAGLTEVQTYSYYSTKVLDSLGWYENDNLKHLVKILNPISAETEYLRMDLWPNLVEAIDKNLRQGIKDIAIFEIGKVYSPKTDAIPKEKYRLAIALMNGSDNPISELLSIARTTLPIQIASSQTSGSDNPLFHPTRHIGIKFEAKQIGGIAEVHPKLANKLGIEKRIAILEINLEPLLK